MRSAHSQAAPFGKFETFSSATLGMRATIFLNLALEQFGFVSHFDIPIQDFQAKPG